MSEKDEKATPPVIPPIPTAPVIPTIPSPPVLPTIPSPPTTPTKVLVRELKREPANLGTKCCQRSFLAEFNDAALDFFVDSNCDVKQVRWRDEF